MRAFGESPPPRSRAPLPQYAARTGAPPPHEAPRPACAARASTPPCR
ncbi:extensin [Burkholderia mallei]|nr:extensin [Burkholderia mallei]EDK60571.1 hypothetical protein BMAJHU_C0661 [Burkholderia mallei JHU]EDP89603.1 extensin [Burkholderia mallei ATCC 10399]ATE32135.1 extensin [Burkholderia mallei]ATE37105.1 extensin [Burkholderia mallei]